jgi:hypothetical protein
VPLSSLYTTKNVKNHEKVPENNGGTISKPPRWPSKTTIKGE